MMGSIQTFGFPDFLASVHEATSGTCPDHAGSGDSTVRAQIHAIGVNFSPSGPVASGYRCPIRRAGLIPASTARTPPRRRPSPAPGPRS